MMSQHHRRESGFALLFVFLMAAFIAISLYVELPRVAFEGRRRLEQDLIDRGEQYRRAIQLYVRQYRRYPPNLDALENTNNIRYLRKKYKDPMTGEAEWRLIHVGPGGVLTDSLVHKPGEAEGEPASVNTFIMERPSIGSTIPAGAEGAASGVAALGARRASEGGPPFPAGGEGEPQPGFEAQPGTEQPGFGQQPEGAGQPVQPVPFAPIGPPGFPQQQPMQPQPGFQPQPGPGQVFPQPGAVQQYPVPGQPYPFPVPPGSQPQGQPAPPFSPQPVPGLPGAYAQPFGQQQPGSTTPQGVQRGPVPFIPQPGFGGAPGAQGQPAQPGAPGAGANPAVDLIRRLLTTPNPRGAAAIQARQTAAQTPQIGPGVAGVASKYEADSIKVYNEREKYNEWEFIYDFSKDPQNARLGGPAAGAPGQQQGQPHIGPGGPQPGGPAAGPQPSPAGPQLGVPLRPQPFPPRGPGRQQ